MGEKSPNSRTPETGGRRGMHGNNDMSGDLLAGVSVQGLGEQVSKGRRRFDVQSQRVDPRVMETALDLAGNDRKRLEFNQDGSVTVKNNPS